MIDFFEDSKSSSDSKDSKKSKDSKDINNFKENCLHISSNNIEMMINKETDETIGELFKSLCKEI